MLKRILFSGLLLCLFSTAVTAKRGQCLPEGEWRQLKTSEKPQLQDVLETLQKQQVALLGEDHDNAEHHRWQLHLISQLHSRIPDIVIGFESFPRDTQQVLDQWVRGELSDKEFLKKSEWDKVWSFDAAHYMPMFHYARMHRIPMIALNVPRGLVSRVSDEGWDNIAKKDREGITDPKPANDDYLNVLAEVFSQHMSGKQHGSGEDGGKIDFDAIKKNDMFKRFVQGQLLWDRAMAQAIADRLRDKKTQLVVGIMGAGHVMGRYGVPYQLADLKVKKVSTLLPWDDAMPCDQLNDELADFAFGVRAQENIAKHEQSKPRLGVYLEPSDKGVLISKLVPDSVAAQAGIKAKDLIIKIAGRPANEISDVVQTVQSMAFGTWLPLSIQRDGKEMEIIAKFPAKP